MSETPPSPFEPKVEHIPTPEEVHEVLGRMVKGEYRETKRHMDEQGNLYRLDAIAPGTEEGESIELFYRRKVYTDGSRAAEINIHSMYVKNDSYGPAGPQADLIDGNWVLID